MGRSRHSGRVHIWLLVTVAILFVGVYLAARRLRQDALRSELSDAAAQEASYLFENLEDRLLFIAEDLRDVCSTRPPADQADHSEIVGHLLHANKFLQTINFIDADRRIRYVCPLEGNREVVGLTIEIAQPRAALEKALASGEPRLSPPFEILQGETGYSLMVPTPSEGVFEVVFKAESVFSPISPFRRGHHLAVRIQDGGVVVHECPDFRNLASGRSAGTSTLRKSLLNRMLIFLAVPKEQMRAGAVLFWETLAGGSVLLVVLLLGAVVVVQGRRAREREAAEKLIRNSERWHRLLFETSRDAIMTVEPPSWRFTSANPAALGMFGVEDEAEFCSLSPWDVSPEHQPDGRPSAEKAGEMMETAMREGDHFFEWQHERLDAEQFPATVLLTRMQIQDDVLLQATVRDITRRKKQEEKLETLNARLEQAVQKLAELSITDELTELPNRRRLDQKIEEELIRSQRTDRIFSLVMIDLDHFKRVNDRYGHQKGDEVLKQCARTLQENVRDMDLLARYGGEEFCVLMPETDAEQAREVAERLRRAVSSRPDPVPTVSMGVAHWQPGLSTEEVVRRADEALYAAKEAGRDRVVVHHQSRGSRGAEGDS